MIRVVEEKKTCAIKKLLNDYKFSGGHYCYNIDLISEVKDGLYNIKNVACGVKKVVYEIVYINDSPCLIAPIEIKKNIASIIGTNEYFDFVDIFYRSDVELYILSQAFNGLLSFFRRHKLECLNWNYLPGDSVIKLILDDMTDYVKQIDNVSIQFESHQSLISSLSKSTKQNLRTAENRLKRDGKEYSLISNYYEPFPKKQIQQCIDLYFTRQKEKYAKNFFNQAMIKTINFTTQMMRKNKGLFVALVIDGEITAFMFGYININSQSYEVPKLAINDDYGFYSPGMVLISKAVEFFSNNTDIRKLDLCRGTEQYKLKMGGEIYHTYNYSISLI